MRGELSEGRRGERRGERLQRRFAWRCCLSSDNLNRSESLGRKCGDFSNFKKANMCSNRVELWASCTNINFSSRRSKFPSFFNAPAAAALRGVVKCRGHISFHALPPYLLPFFHELFIIFDTFQRLSSSMGGPGNVERLYKAYCFMCFVFCRNDLFIM